MGRPSDARERLIEGALTLLHARSYAAAGVDDLCAQAGVKKGSFYHFFPAKRDLAVAAIERQWSNARRYVLDPSFAPDVSPLQRLRRLFTLAALLQRPDDPVAGHVRGCPFGNLAAELGTQDPVIRARLKEVFAGYHAYFERALVEAQEAGELGPLDAPAAARTLLALFEGALLLAKTYDDAAIVERVGQDALDLIAGRSAIPAGAMAGDGDH
jgi:TetR/AcrR family transcriptional repressor of nem operon